jgi:pimeloyl-ACP methyl ester carboxylesterase
VTAPAPIRVPVDDGVELSVLAWSLDGPAAPVALVHGLASNARLWDGVAPELAARGHPVVALDQRGHGLSSKPSGGYDFARLSLDLLEVFSRLGWSGERAPVVAGQSWGGNVALDLAAHHPRSLSGLVLVDGGTIELSPRFADWPTCEAALAPPPLAGTPFEDFERLVRAAHPGWPEAGIQGTLANV